MTEAEILSILRASLGVKQSAEGFTVTELCAESGFCRPTILRGVHKMVKSGAWEPITVLRPRVSGPMSRQAGYRVKLGTTPWAEIRRGKAERVKGKGNGK